MLVGAEDHKLTIYDVPKDGSAPKIVAATTGHTNRLVLFVLANVV